MNSGERKNVFFLFLERPTDLAWSMVLSRGAKVVLRVRGRGVLRSWSECEDRVSDRLIFPFSGHKFSGFCYCCCLQQRVFQSGGVNQASPAGQRLERM